MNVLILTCTARVHKNVHVERNREADRISDYIDAIDFWNSISDFDKIIVVDNSGYDFSVHRQSYSPRMEFLSFNADGLYDASLGKGYGEYLILKHAIDNLPYILTANKVFKCTGRYTIKNAKKLVKGCVNEIGISADFSRNLSWVDSRFFCVNPLFFEVGFPLLKNIDESQGMHMEVYLARAVHSCMAAGCGWGLLSTTPFFQGHYGASNTRYSENIFKLFCKAVLKSIKRFAINIRY